MIVRCGLGVFLTGVVGVASAGYEPFDDTSHWIILPEQPTTRTAVMVRNVVKSCHPPSGAYALDVDLATQTITLYEEPGNDTACPFPTEVETYRDTILGYLPAGSYVLRFGYCDLLQDFANPPCHVTDAPTLQFVVSEAGRPRQTIPAWSAGGAAAAVVLLTAIAFFRLRARG